MPLRSRRPTAIARAISLIKQVREALKAAVSGSVRAHGALPVPIRVEDPRGRRR